MVYEQSNPEMSLKQARILPHVPWNIVIEFPDYSSAAAVGYSIAFYLPFYEKS
jgi:hypothetical protein